MYSNFQIHVLGKELPRVDYRPVPEGHFVTLELSFEQTHFTLLLDNAEIVRELGRRILNSVPVTFVDPAMA